MADDPAIERLLRQQSAIADFGSFAFGESHIDKILSEAVKICAKGLSASFAKICRYRAEENDLLVEAGCGWDAGVVGYVVSPADVSSTQGRTFVTGLPVILEDVTKNDSYSLPKFYAQHGIVATIDVLIKGGGEPWGVLEVDSPTPRVFDQNDVNFLTGFANVIAEAVAIAERTKKLQLAVSERDQLIAEKNKLLEEYAESECRMRDMQSDMLRVTRLTALGQMTAAIAHELNQPLSAITNYIGAARLTLSSQSPNQEAIGKALGMVTKASGQTLRAGEIIKNLRDFVAVRGGHQTNENLSAVVMQTLELAKLGSISDDILVSTDFDEQLPLVTIDKIQIQQVLTNLIQNSLDAMSELAGGKLLLRTGMGEPGFAVVTVQDTGAGIDDRVRDRLFHPFVTTKGSGMGLGLMICETFVKSNGGQIWVLKGLAEGSGFCFSVPLMVSH